jgi:hypothetical protein
MCSYITRIVLLNLRNQYTGADVGFRLSGQLSDCNSLSGSNSLTNRILNKNNNNLIYSYLIKNYQNNILLHIKNNNKIKLKNSK